MNLKTTISNLVTGNTNTMPAAQQAMQARVSTLAGCEALRGELLAAKADSIPYGAAARLLGRQLEEVDRLTQLRVIEADRKRLDAVYKRDAESTAKAVKQAHIDLKNSDALVESTAADEADLVERVARMEVQLTTKRQNAADRVNQAKKAFELAALGGDEAAEEDAAEELYEAKKANADAGGGIGIRLDSLKAQLALAKHLANEAREAQKAAVDGLNLAYFNVTALKYDKALQTAYDAYLEAKVASYPLPYDVRSRCNIAEFEAGFVSVERALVGERLLNERKLIRKYVSAEFVRVHTPANLALLTEAAPLEMPAEEGPLPDASQFIPGSMQHDNALSEIERRRAANEPKPRVTQSA